MRRPRPESLASAVRPACAPGSATRERPAPRGGRAHARAARSPVLGAPRAPAWWGRSGLGASALRRKPAARRGKERAGAPRARARRTLDSWLPVDAGEGGCPSTPSSRAPLGGIIAAAREPRGSQGPAGSPSSALRRAHSHPGPARPSASPPAPAATSAAAAGGDGPRAAGRAGRGPARGRGRGGRGGARGGAGHPRGRQWEPDRTRTETRG